MDGVKLKAGDKIVHGLSYSLPEGWTSVELEWVDRKWWQFYLPKQIHVYSKIVNEKEGN